jgi:LmbE family N-acetylglucosaminyl deacetylase
VKEFLVIAPHVDDEALGCGGVIDERFHVHYSGVEDHHEVPRDERLEEAGACAALLGFSFTVDLDTTVNAYEVPALVGRIERLVSEVRPHTVLVPYPSYNQDHRAVLDAALTALRPHDRNPFVPNVLVYEQVQVGVWPYREDLLGGRTFHPQLYAPIDVQRKIAAYRCHRSQMREMRSVAAVVALAERRGRESGHEHAEAFQVARMCEPTVLDLGRRAVGGAGDE